MAEVTWATMDLGGQMAVTTAHYSCGTQTTTTWPTGTTAGEIVCHGCGVQFTLTLYP